MAFAMVCTGISRVRVAALILACVAAALALVPAQAQVAAAHESPTEVLGRNLRLLATDSRNFQALIGAGRKSKYALDGIRTHRAAQRHLQLV
jgi:hypothetical protein